MVVSTLLYQLSDYLAFFALRFVFLLAVVFFLATLRPFAFFATGRAFLFVTFFAFFFAVVRFFMAMFPYVVTCEIKLTLSHR